ncbi:MAG: transcription antiterminator [Micrococcaceae bacterium]
MYFSERKQQLLSLLLAYPKGVSIGELQEVLNVSNRTVYRELASVEKRIATLGIEIIKKRGSGYHLVGKEDKLAELKELLATNFEEGTFTNNAERQNAILCTLLASDTEWTVEKLAGEFSVSPATITADIQELEQKLSGYELEFDKLKGKGSKLVGNEKEKRQILGNLIANGVSEYDFFQFLNKLETDKFPTSANFFLKQLNPKSLYLAKTILYQVSKQSFDNVTDNQLQRSLVLLTLSIERVTKGMFIDIAHNFAPSTENMQVANQVMAKVASITGSAIPGQEVRFLAQQLEGINYRKPHSIFIDDFDAELSYKVKQLISLVARDTNHDFPKDEQLYANLLAHMQAALKRNLTLTGKVTNIPVLQKIKEKYQDLFSAVAKELEVVFSQHEFIADELGYIAVHFAVSLEKHPAVGNAKVLVISSRGIDTGRIVESQLRKHLPEISSVKLAKPSELGSLDFASYDLILSTNFLPNFTKPYKVISPLLPTETISELQELLKAEGGASAALTTVASHNSGKEPSETFYDLFETIHTADKLLQIFKVSAVSSSATVEDTLAKIIAGITNEFVTNASYVTKKVIERYKEAPIGIPHEDFALFHSSNTKVKQPFFQVFDIDRPFTIQGMDRKNIELNRILLMLAPKPMSESQKLLLGKISSSVIESDINSDIYKYGGSEIIYELLSSLFLKAVQES